MEYAWLRLKEDPDGLFLGCGSHEEIVVTLGRDNLKQGPCLLPSNAIVRQLDRGGGMTAHEPGQIVLYPIFHLDRWGLTVPVLVDILETCMMDLLSELGLRACRHNSGPGVYVGEQKIGFIGLRIKERIVQHGLALNMTNDAGIFRAFDPCGVRGLPITTAAQHVDMPHALSHYQERLVRFFLCNLLARTTMGISFDVGVLLSSATDSSGTSTFPSGK